MAKKKRKKDSLGKCMILIGSITVLNLMGISYGYWNGGLQMIASLSTGKMDLEVIPRNDQITLTPGSTGSLSYEIVDYSTIPVKFGEYEVMASEGIYVDYNDGNVLVEVPKDQDPGDYSFEIELKYYQAND
ncbi:hypothetical protein CACET_c08920 [Clostridium aceticum]|uniref:Uncharacterized protein n=1 Tax=Clostridium aceticum TaxID=84022 RepID=A0A0D8IDM7_9CLOT|nr:hypothetical protein [Clostridium aceticum]AKL94400.1 hypothetical protein CACET_c08920 [Clostridium aceticum]KJF28373.1 hypothetical protein TZ02_03135 [Clostridium aceticum]